MSECVRELSSKELIEQSDCKNKELILSRLKAEDDRVCKSIQALEKEIDRQRHLITSFREVLNELEELKQEFKNDRCIHEAIAVNISIERIKQKLAEIEGKE